MHRELDESIAALRCSNRITACVERENEMTRPINHAFIDQSFFFFCGCDYRMSQDRLPLTCTWDTVFRKKLES